MHTCTWLYTVSFFFTCNLSCTYSDIVFFRCLEYMDHLITLLEEHPEVELHDTLKDGEENYSVSHNQDTCTYALSLFPLSLSLSFTQSPDKPYKIHGSILVFVERMDEEFTKVLQATDPHSTDFVTKYDMQCTMYLSYTTRKKKKKTHR